MDLDTKSLPEIEQMILNYAADPKARTTSAFKVLLEERARRQGEANPLKIDRSLEHLRQAAIRGVPTTYGELARASGVSWTRARVRMNGKGGHLDRLLDVCHARGLPLLTAICVDQGGVSTGDLSDNALAGFTTGVRNLGIDVTDPRVFHRAECERCWAWGRMLGPEMP